MLVWFSFQHRTFLSVLSTAVGDGCDGETSPAGAPDCSVLEFLRFFRLMLNTWDFPTVVVLSAGLNEHFSN